VVAFKLPYNMAAKPKTPAAAAPAAMIAPVGWLAAPPWLFDDDAEPCAAELEPVLEPVPELRLEVTFVAMLVGPAAIAAEACWFLSPAISALQMEATAPVEPAAATQAGVEMG